MVVLSIHSDAASRARARAAVATYFLPKGTPMGPLVAAIRRAAGRDGAPLRARPPRVRAGPRPGPCPPLTSRRPRWARRNYRQKSETAFAGCRAGAHAFPARRPRRRHRARVAEFARLRDSYAAQWNRVANVRLGAFVLAAVALGWGVWQGILPLTAAGLVLLAAFFVLVYRHNQLRRARDRYAGLTRLNEEAGLRLARDWDHLPARHTATAPPGHAYAADLDLFGHASLFQLLEAVGTHLGEATLARWLLAPAPLPTVAARQAAVADLAPRIDWRDELALRGRALGDPRPDPTPFLLWAEESLWLLPQRALLWAGRISVVALWALLLAQVLGLVAYPFWVPWSWSTGRCSRCRAGGSGPCSTGLWSVRARSSAYANSFELVTSATFAAPALTALQARLARARPLPRPCAGCIGGRASSFPLTTCSTCRFS